MRLRNTSRLTFLWGALLTLCAGMSLAQTTPAITKPEVFLTDETTAWVVFSTDLPTKATVEFHSTNGASRTVTEATFDTEHAVLLTGLVPGLIYEGTVTAVTEQGGTGNAAIDPFVAEEPQQDVNFNVSPEVLFTSPNDAFIAFTTNTPSTAQVTFGRPNSPQQTIRDDEPTKTHTLPLTGLLPNATYTYIVTVKGQDGSIASTAPTTFKVQPLDTDLAITTPEVFQTGEGSAFVIFNTTKPARATVEFQSTNGAARTVTEATFDTEHAVLLPDLITGLTYSVRVTAVAEDGSNAVAYAQPFTATDVERPVGFEIQPQVIFTSPNDALITFTTNTPSTARVDVSRPNSPGQTVRDTEPTRTHALPLTGLLPNATYTFIVTVTGADGSIASTAPATFKVQPFETDLDISTPEVFQTGEGSAFLIFNTTRPARATVTFGFEGGADLTVSETALETEHAILLPNLIKGLVYTATVFVTADDGSTAVAFVAPFLVTDVERDIGFEVPPTVLLIGADQALVTFTTTAPSTARVDYGLNGALNLNVSETTPTDTHALTLPGLQVNGTYTFIVTIKGENGSISTTAPATFTVTPPDGGGFKVGDVDLDGFVDVRDVVLLLRFAVGILPLTLEQRDVADVNKDGAVNVVDAVRVLQIIVGVSP